MEGNRLILGGADIVDGSPVLDIKPYVPFCDSLPGAAAPPWVQVRAPAGAAPLGVGGDPACRARLCQTPRKEARGRETPDTPPEHYHHHHHHHSHLGHHNHYNHHNHNNNTNNHHNKPLNTAPQAEAADEPLKLSQVEVPPAVAAQVDAVWRAQRKASVFDSSADALALIKEVGFWGSGVLGAVGDSGGCEGFGGCEGLWGL